MLALLVLVSGAWAQDQADYFAYGSRPHPHDWSGQYALGGHGNRSYWTLTPASPFHTGAIVVLHGAQFMGAIMPGFIDKFTTRALGANYVLAYGQAVQDFNWDAGTCCVDDRQYDDQEYVGKIIDHLTFKGGFGSHNIFVVGFSNGASLSVRVGCTLNHKIAGVACMHGSLETTNAWGCNSQRDRGNGHCGDWDSNIKGCDYNGWKRSFHTPGNPQLIYTCDYAKQIVHYYSHSRDDGWDHTTGESCDANTGSGDGSPYVPTTFMYQYLLDSYGRLRSSVVYTYAATAKAKCSTFSDGRGNAKLEFCHATHGGHRWYGDPVMQQATMDYWDANTAKPQWYTMGGLYDMLGEDPGVLQTSDNLIDFFNRAVGSGYKRSEDVFV